MSGSISGWLVNIATGERVASPEVKLYRPGVPGEIEAMVDAAGGFLFAGLEPGEYTLGAYNSPFVPKYERFVLGEGEAVSEVPIELTPGGFLSGWILDEHGRAASHCHYTPITWARHPSGKVGYCASCGSFQVATDGNFLTPPLEPGRYYLRFSGIMQKPEQPDPALSSEAAIRQRIFDFVLPATHDICSATGFDVKSGETAPELQITIPKPVWRKVQGRVIGELPATSGRFNVIVSQDFGTVDEFGGGGGPQLDPDGTFKHWLQPGRYSAEVWEFGDPKPDGRSTVLRQFGPATKFTVADEDVFGLEIPLGGEIYFDLQSMTMKSKLSPSD